MIFKGISELVKHIGESDKSLYEALKRLDQGVDNIYSTITQILEPPEPAPTCRLTHGVDQNINNAANTILALNTSVVDVGAMHDATFNSRMSVRRQGYYITGLNVQWAFNAAGDRNAVLLLNGTTIIADSLIRAASGVDTVHEVTTLHYFNYGDYVEAQVAQTSGGVLAVKFAGNYSPVLWSYWLGN